MQKLIETRTLPLTEDKKLTDELNQIEQIIPLMEYTLNNLVEDLRKGIDLMSNQQFIGRTFKK